MKNINKYCLIILLSGLLLSGCEDYLDQDPQDQVTEAIYFETAEQFENAANLFYTRLAFDDGDESSDLSGNLTDSDLYGQGLTIVPTTDDIWLKIIAFLKGYKTVKVHTDSKEWFTIKNSQKKSLMDNNVQTID